jgi:hypothetical protein
LSIPCCLCSSQTTLKHSTPACRSSLAFLQRSSACSAAEGCCEMMPRL